MKLNLSTKNIEDESRIKNGLAPKNLYNSPIGWWNVTTEGDEEGRSTRQLGLHYGHVAEIAFWLAIHNFYKLTFEAKGLIPLNTAIMRYEATARSVYIALDYTSKIDDLSKDEQVKWFTNWFGDTDPKITITTGCYYNSVKLEI